MNLMRTILAGVATTLLASSANAVVLYEEDFDAEVAPAVSGGIADNYSLDSARTGAWNASGWAGNYALNNSTGVPAGFTTISLTGLLTHTTISASFMLGFLESWDSSNGNCCTPDHLEIWIDGAKVSDMTANNALGTVEDFDLNPIVAHYQQVNGNEYYSDTLIDYGLTFAHSASSLTFAIRAAGGGWQGGGDEAWGIDNIVFTYDGVGGGGAAPEPAAWALMLAGFGLAGTALRRRRVATTA